MSLTGAARRAAPVYASGGLYADGDVAGAGDEMRRYVAQGFPAVKLKIGALRDG